LYVEIGSGKSVRYCEFASHSFRASRSGTHRTTEDPSARRGDEHSSAGRAFAANAIEKYGTAGEKLSRAQMELFPVEPVLTNTPVEAESKPEPLNHATKNCGKHPGRQQLPPNLPRVERVLPCTPDQRVCRRCGKETVVIGYEKSSQLDVEPAKYFVLVTKREKPLAGPARNSE
jgi:hypothetical protein